MTRVAIPFAFPGEGAVICGVLVTPEDEPVPEQLRWLANYPHSLLGKEDPPDALVSVQGVSAVPGSMRGLS